MWAASVFNLGLTGCPFANICELSVLSHHRPRYCVDGVAASAGDSGLTKKFNGDVLLVHVRGKSITSLKI